MELAQLLKSIRSRKNGRWGIGVASTYLKQLEICVGEGNCPADLSFPSREMWQQAVKDAESRLTYCDPDMEFKAVSGEDLPDCAMVFEAVVTSTRKDRDGDVLVTSGARVDEKHPLLWQHNPMQPIGKFIEVTSRNDRKLAARFAVVDTELGRDAAKLFKFGSLRISHGFAPEDFEPLDEDRPWDGWRIKSFEIMETSGVSVPSNVDAQLLGIDWEKSFEKELDGVRSLYGRGEFESGMVKHWAKHIHDSRPVQGKGCSCKQADPELVSEVDQLRASLAESNEKLEQLRGEVSELTTSIAQRSVSTEDVIGWFVGADAECRKSAKQAFSAIERCENAQRQEAEASELLGLIG